MKKQLCNLCLRLSGIPECLVNLVTAYIDDKNKNKIYAIIESGEKMCGDWPSTMQYENRLAGIFDDLDTAILQTQQSMKRFQEDVKNENLRTSDLRCRIPSSVFVKFVIKEYSKNIDLEKQEYEVDRMDDPTDHAVFEISSKSYNHMSI
jgi:hypothetical protein